MLLFTIVGVALATLLTIGILVAGAGGAVLTIIFSDVIVCIIMMVLLMKFLIGKRKRD